MWSVLAEAPSPLATVATNARIPLTKHRRGMRSDAPYLCASRCQKVHHKAPGLLQLCPALGAGGGAACDAHVNQAVEDGDQIRRALVFLVRREVLATTVAAPPLSRHNPTLSTRARRG